MVPAVTFAGLALDASPFFIQAMTGLAGGVAVRTSDRPRLARDGLIAGTDLLGGRSVGVDLVIVADDDATQDAAVSAALAVFAPGGDPALLSFTISGIAGSVPAQIMVRPRRLSTTVTAPWFDQAAQIDIELFATDPLIYSAAETSAVASLNSTADGLTWPLTWPLAWGSTAGDIGVTATNLGNATAPVVIRVDGPVTNPRVENVTTGQTISLTGTLATGEFVIIDTQARTVLLGGTASRYSWLTLAEWWGLAPGDNEIRFAASAVTAGTATITFRSAWI